MTEPSKEAQEAFTKAMIEMMTSPDAVFFTTVCLSLKHTWNNEIPTARCDGLTIEYNESFFTGLSRAEQVFLILHETLHAAYLHTTRCSSGDYTPERWNAAADYVINDQLIEAGFSMPEGGLHDKRYRDMSADEVYRLLPEDASPKNEDLDLAPSDGDDIELQQEMDEILVRAHIQAQETVEAAGNIPGDLQRYINNLLDPKLPWHSILRRYMNKTTKADYSFRKPNRRFFPEHILPSQHSETLADFTIAVDTSGSVTDDNFNQFISETYSILKRLKPKNLTFLQFDTSIKAEDKIESVNDLKKVKFTGRGGTRIKPVIEWAKVNKPTALIIFTDGYFSMPADVLKCPTIWVIYNNPKFDPPFGKTIHYDI